MLDWESWSREIRQLCRQLGEMEPWHDTASNGIASPSTLEDLASLKARFSGYDLTQLLTFYSRCDGASFPDLWNGYFINPLQLVLRVRDDIPVGVEGSLTREILPFGSDGGGNLIALSLGQQKDLLYLPNGEIRDSIYRDSSSMLMRVLAKDFDGFLKRLLEDFQAFVNGSPGWKYMDGGSK